jgi:hypothetical protein
VSDELTQEQQERRDEAEHRFAEEEQVWSEISELERDGWISMFMDLATAKREAARSRRQLGAGSKLAGQRASRVAPLRARPRGGP